MTTHTAPCTVPVIDDVLYSSTHLYISIPRYLDDTCDNDLSVSVGESSLDQFKFDKTVR